LLVSQSSPTTKQSSNFSTEQGTGKRGLGINHQPSNFIHTQRSAGGIIVMGYANSAQTARRDDAMFIADYVAISVLIALALWAGVDWFR
jgi:hypothetical protein